MGVLKRLKMQTIPVRKIAQGSADPRSEWARASFNQAKQLLVRFRILRQPFNDPPLPPPTASTVNVAEDTGAPQIVVDTETIQGAPSDESFFDLESLGSLDEHQIIFFDETYRTCEIGNIVTGVGKSQVYRFKRNENKKLDPDGNYDDVDHIQVKRKYD